LSVSMLGEEARFAARECIEVAGNVNSSFFKKYSSSTYHLSF
jgi:hypothetical protein